jgi:glycosyltransferase involved in cell wall biosynthesis
MKLSILMPVKNESSYIEESLKSIQQIEYIDFEVVLVDDGSTDKTVERVQELNMPFVKLIRTEGVGKAQAYNLAYKNSGGDFFILLGGDDLLIASTIKARIEPLKESKNTPAVSFCKLISFSQNKRYDSILMPKKKNRGLETGGCIAFNKKFAELTFPIPNFLINEDSWITLHARFFSKKMHIQFHHRQFLLIPFINNFSVSLLPT